MYSLNCLLSRPRVVIPALVAVLLIAAPLHAQETRPERGPGPRDGGFMRMNPLFAALDTNGDGVIDENEIRNAPAALLKLDRNHDGKLTEDEVRPAFGRGGPGGPDGPGGRGPGGREGGGPVNVDEIVARMLQFDKNGDGRLSPDEVPERMRGMFARGDTDKDGFLSRDELVALARRQAEMGRREGERRDDRVERGDRGEREGRGPNEERR